MKTGYFGNCKKHRTKVHFVDENNKPVCGSKVGPDMEFQRCSNAPVLEYVECKTCIKIYTIVEAKRIEELKKQPPKFKNFEF